jgi:hypothetical protein
MSACLDDDLRDVAAYLPRFGTCPETGRRSWFQSFLRIRGAPLLAPPRRLCLISAPRFIALDSTYDGVRL